MLTEAQQSWLNHLSDTDQVKIVPYDPRVKEIFGRQRAELQATLGAEAVVLHKGASAWGISGKGDVDIYVPVAAEAFDRSFELLRAVLGEPGSHYPLTRVRWNRLVEGLDVEVLLVNQAAQFYRDNCVFWHHLETHPEALAQYAAVKAAAAGQSSRAYYTHKAVFISQVLQTVRAAEPARTSNP